MHNAKANRTQKTWETGLTRWIKTVYGIDQSEDEPDLQNRKICENCGIAFGLKGTSPMRRITEGEYKHERC